MAKKLEGKVAVITGGNSGMGLATAKLFVREGAHVYITGRRQKELDAAVSEIGRNVTAISGDVSNLDDLDRLYATVKEKNGKAQLVFANAGAGELVPFGNCGGRQQCGDDGCERSPSTLRRIVHSFGMGWAGVRPQPHFEATRLRFDEVEFVVRSRAHACRPAKRPVLLFGTRHGLT